jgi:hypothetical protein
MRLTVAYLSLHVENQCVIIEIIIDTLQHAPWKYAKSWKYSPLRPMNSPRELNSAL